MNSWLQFVRYRKDEQKFHWNFAHYEKGPFEIQQQLIQSFKNEVEAV